jgi:hypothetical protein
MLLESGLSSAFVANLNDTQMKSLVERFGRDKKITIIKNSELKDKVKDFIKKYSKITNIENNIDEWSDEKLVNQIKGYAKRASSGDANKMADDLYKQIEKSSKGSKKEETKEQSTTPQNTTPVTTSSTKYIVKPNSKTMINGVEVDTTGGKTSITPLKENVEMSEKFESKAQQGFFWAKCNTSKGVKKKKWCEMAKEFSDSTSKKQYKDMPEKKHPEKTVKRKTRKNTDENYEKYLEEQIFNMIEKHIEPSMTKGELLRTIQEKVDKSEKFMLSNPKKNTMFQKETKESMMKKPIGKMFSIGKEMKEDTKEKEKTKTKPGTKTPTRKNPFKDPNPGVEEQPKANTREKERTKEREKTKTPTRKNPFRDPNPGVKEQPKAEEQKNDFMSAIESILNK